MTNKTYRTYTTAIVLLAIGYWLLAGTAAFAATDASTETVEIGPFCFRAAECGTFQATTGPKDPLCTQLSPGHSQKAVEFGYHYNCYTKPPNVKLQVSIGGYNVEGIEQYIQRLYIFLVGISSLVAGIMIVWAGVKWLTSAGSPDKITDAKKKIGNALIGMVLVLSSYVILQTINPALVSLQLPPVKIVRPAATATSEWCVNREEFKCGGEPEAAPGRGKDGQYSCSETSYLDASNPPCGGPQAGSCFGQWCAEGTGGCHQMITDRIVRPGDFHITGQVKREVEENKSLRTCIDSSSCNNCNLDLHNADNSFNISNIYTCLSAACDCLITRDLENLGVDRAICTKRKQAEENCNSDQECESENCNTGPVPDVCGPADDESLCNRDIECVSGICNSEENPVLQVGFAAGRCRSPGWGEPGDECDRPSVCQSRRCGADRECTNLDGTEYD